MRLWPFGCGFDKNMRTKRGRMNTRFLIPGAAAISVATVFLSGTVAARAQDAAAAVAATPPMGWNSWDCFATTVTEAQTKAQADVMADKLARSGWQYIVVDIQWYEPQAKGFDYRKDAKLTMDEWGRLLPAPNRFPSGFKALADYIHRKGLKFGIHLMRGIPRQAVAQNTPVKGTNVRAADIADTNSVCSWNTDMFGVDMTKPGAQNYYDSVFELIASWDVDFVKVDDLSRPYHKAEIEAIRRAMDKTGRPMVFSTSPGATPLEEGDHIRRHANLWRISDDFWDKWPELFAQFRRLRDWTPYRSPGRWPDADMLPLGTLELGRRTTRFTPDEQYTMMTLWCMARSPLMIGADLTKLDEFTLSLLTNEEVLAVNQHSDGNRELFNRDGWIAWVADVPDSKDKYLALFNTRGETARVPVKLSGACRVRDLWQRQDLGEFKDEFAPEIASHGAKLYRLSPGALAAQTDTASVTVALDQPGTKISPDLFGIFFEDINYAADGGLYAELVQNRSFEYSAADRPGWNSLTAWQEVGNGTVEVRSDEPLHPNNPHYAVLTGADVGLKNVGFDGIALQAGEKYDASLFARGVSGPILIRLESKAGELYGQATVPKVTRDWTKYTATIQAAKDDADARLVIRTTNAGPLCLDMISLFPQKTFRNRPNGLRADLAQVIANLKPKFVRFPGGCLVHGDGLANMYRWKDTIGAVEQRREQRNIWGYHQSVGLGYFEYFQFCEDIGAKPLPVVPAGVCCQNSGRQWGRGQKGLPMEEMPAYVQDVLDLIEWANGPVTSKWGALRAAAGHPQPFGLKYLGVGNEEQITPVFRERFRMIYEAVKARYPDITVIGTVGPFHSGTDFEEGWKFANELHLEMVDEHYYDSPAWFLGNLNRYDSYDRSKSKVYIGEYASRDRTLFNALAEAAYMTSLERNGDLVRLASYAPLLGKERHTQWNPNLIYFNNTAVHPTPSYYVQQLFSHNQGDVALPVTVTLPPTAMPPGGVMVGTWDTQAEFDDVRVTSDSTVLVDEHFEGAPKGWFAESGDWSVSDGAYRQAASDQPALSRISFPQHRRGYTYTLRARKLGGKEGFLIGFGASGSDSYYWWNLGGWGNERHGVEKISYGAKNIVGKQVPGSIESNRWYNIKIEFHREWIRCYLDDVLIHDLAITPEVWPTVAASCVKDTQTGDIILKLVNVSPSATTVQVRLTGGGKIKPTARRTILTGEPRSRDVQPVTTDFAAAKSFAYDAPAYSLTVIRMETAP